MARTAKRIWARGRYRKIKGQRRYYDIVAHRSITEYQYRTRRDRAPRRKDTKAYTVRQKQRKHRERRTTLANAKRADTLAKAYQAKQLYKTGKRPSLKTVRADPHFRQLLADLARDTKGRSRTSRRARVLVQLGLRDTSWTHNVGDSLPGELSDARAAAILMGHGI